MTLLTIALLLAQTSEAPAAEDTAPAPVEVEAPAPAEPNPWTAGLSLGFTWISGNVESMSLIGGAEAARKTSKTIWVTRAAAAYGEKFGAAPEILMYSAAITSQFDYRFTHWISAFVGAGLDTDHVKSVEIRGYGELGAGFTWIDTKDAFGGDKEEQKAFVKTDLSLRVQPESRFQYYPIPLQVPDVFLFGPRLAATAHYAFTKTAYVHEELELLPSVLSPQRVLLNSTSKLGVVLLSGFALTAGFTFKYDSQPAPSKKAIDTILSVGLETRI